MTRSSWHIRRMSVEIGSMIGLNVRVAPYSGVGAEQLRVLRGALTRSAEELRTQYVALPIDLERDADLLGIRELAGEHIESSDRAVPATPTELVTHIRRCRITITGSYHAGVFSLAQGTPVIGLSQSEYYDQKFRGLQSQFGDGVEIVRLDAPNAAENLRLAVHRTWNSAERLRIPLRAAAKRQIADSISAYRNFLQ